MGSSKTHGTLDIYSSGKSNRAARIDGEGGSELGVEIGVDGSGWEREETGEGGGGVGDAQFGDEVRLVEEDDGVRGHVGRHGGAHTERKKLSSSWNATSSRSMLEYDETE